ncbi:hypothetical protein NIB75_11280 [Bacteroides uniformis]|nr:hypothetical protein [Bacteroides uniformis]
MTTTNKGTSTLYGCIVTFMAIRLMSRAPSNDELRNKVRKLKNVELSENKDWNDDLKISCGICSSTEDGQ